MLKTSNAEGEKMSGLRMGDEASLPEQKWASVKGTVPSLDGVRAISVSIVLVGHMLLPASWVGISAIGLKIFFFISGFLIARLLIAEHKEKGQISLSGFYWRRVLRLYPVILFYVGLVVSVSIWRGLDVRGIDVAGVFLYFVNYLVIHYDNSGQTMSIPVSMLWSLSVEEHFYLFAPLALVLLRGDPKRMLLGAVAICFVSLGLRLFYAHSWPEMLGGLEIYWRSETRFDCIAFGVILACMTEFPAGRAVIKTLSSRWFFIAGVGLLLLSYAYRDSFYQLTWRFTIQSLALYPIMIGVVFACPFPIVNKILNTRVFVWVGALSYSLYVWHGGVVFLFGSLLDKLPAGMISYVEFVMAFALAVASYYLIERPALGLRHFLIRPATKAPGTEIAIDGGVRK